jgi:hypothetical protein
MVSGICVKIISKEWVGTQIKQSKCKIGGAYIRIIILICLLSKVFLNAAWVYLKGFFEQW